MSQARLHQAKPCLYGKAKVLVTNQGRCEGQSVYERADREEYVVMVITWNFTYSLLNHTDTHGVIWL